MCAAFQASVGRARRQDAGSQSALMEGCRAGPRDPDRAEQETSHGGEDGEGGDCERGTADRVCYEGSQVLGRSAMRRAMTIATKGEPSILRRPSSRVQRQRPFWNEKPPADPSNRLFDRRSLPRSMSMCRPYQVPGDYQSSFLIRRMLVAKSASSIA